MASVAWTSRGCCSTSKPSPATSDRCPRRRSESTSAPSIWPGMRSAMTGHNCSTSLSVTSLSAVGDVAHALRHPRETVTETVATGQSIARFVEPVSDTLSPVMTERHLAWHYDVLEFPLDGDARCRARRGSKAQRCLPLRRHGRTSPLPRTARQSSRRTARHDADQHPQSGRADRRQPDHAHEVQGSGGHRRPERADGRDSPSLPIGRRPTGRCRSRTRSRAR